MDEAPGDALRVLDEVEDRALRLDDGPQMALYGNRATRDRSNLDLTRAEHERILDAVARRDPEAARERLTEHLARVRDLRIADLVEGRD